jgi:hypothetical protein
MSVNIDTVFVQKFRSDLQMLAEQEQSRLRDCAIVESVIGRSAWFDQIGHVAAQENTTRNGDTPITDVPFSRRLIHIKDWDVHELIDRKDERKMLAGPVPKVASVLNAAMNRAMDQDFLVSIFATAYTGASGATTVAFPAANQIAVNDWSNGAGSGNAGLTISKLISAKEILDNNEVDGDEAMAERFIACTPKQISNLLSTTEATSGDFAEVKALVRGEIDSFMGFTFKRLSSRIVPVNGSGFRRVACWQRAGVYIGMNEDITGDIGPRRDKRGATQASCFASWGIARVEESRVVEIICSEA